MSLNHQKLALAAAAVMSAFFIVCAAFTALLPNLAFKLFGWLMMLDLTEFISQLDLSAAAIIGGLAQTFIYTYVFVWFLAWLYNKLLASK